MSWGICFGALTWSIIIAITLHCHGAKAQVYSVETTNVPGNQSARMAQFKININVVFDYKSTQLTQQSRSNLADTAILLDKLGDSSAIIAGYTDSIGSYAYNVNLSQQRAYQVKAALVKVFGVEAKRLTAIGYGEINPVSDNGNEEGRSENRRVELLIDITPEHEAIINKFTNYEVSGLNANRFDIAYDLLPVLATDDQSFYEFNDVEASKSFETVKQYDDVVMEPHMLESKNISDLGLAALVRLAVDSSPAVKSSRALMASLQSDIDAARWQYYPTPQFKIVGAAASDNDQSYLGDDYSATIGLSQPLWSGGLIGSQLRESKSSFAIANAANLNTIQEVALGVVAAYSRWHSANMRLSAWQRSFKIHKRLYDQTERRVADGASSVSDLTLARARVLDVEGQILAAAADENISITELVELVGRPLTTKELVCCHVKPMILIGNGSVLKTAAQQVSPLIAEALAEVDLANAEINTVKAERMPQVNLRIERQFGDLSFANMAPTNRLLVEINSRFSAGFSAGSQDLAARLRRDAAVANLNIQRRRLEAEIVSDLALNKSIEKQIIILQQSEQATRAVYESYERQNLSGTRSALDVLDLAKELSQAEIILSDTKIDKIKISWRLSIKTIGLISTLKQAT